MKSRKQKNLNSVKKFEFELFLPQIDDFSFISHEEGLDIKNFTELSELDEIEFVAFDFIEKE